ncbi:MAG TPA: sulfotransferase domain-containing protein [Candidatus Limnocylindrales bacterium]
MTQAKAGKIARGSDGADVLRRIYRRSPLRRILKVDRDHRGLTEKDVFVASYPRSGNAWLRFLLLEMTGRRSGFDTAYDEVPYVGAQAGAPSLVPGGGRLIKTHEPYLPVYRRAIHLVRDPRDIVVSYFRYMQRVEQIVVLATDDERASFDHFVDAFVDGRADAHGTWQTHLDSWLDAARNGRCAVLRVRYEDLRADPQAHVMEIGRWLGLDISAGRAAEVVEICSLERMRAAEREAMRSTPHVVPRAARHSGISLLGQGAVEGWRQVLTSRQQRRFEAFDRGLLEMGYDPA